MSEKEENLSKQKSVRLTFEDMRANLEKLREWLDHLFDENRPLRVDERREFFDTVDRALMGLARSVKIEGELILKSSNLPGSTKIENIEDLFGFLAYHNAKVSTDDEGVDHKIEELWGLAREKLLVARSVVLEAATRLSQEQWFVPEKKRPGRA